MLKFFWADVIAISLLSVTSLGVAGAPDDLTTPSPEPSIREQSGQRAQKIESAPLEIAQLAEFTINYEARYGAFKGTASLALSATDQPDEYVYQVETTARGLARLAQPGALEESSRFIMTVNGVRPLSYAYDEGSGKAKDQSSIAFDWSQHTAQCVHKGVPVQLSLDDTIKDRLSADLQTILELRAGKVPTTQTIAYRNSIREYELLPRGKKTITTPAGSFDTVRFLRQRQGSKRATMIWFAQDIGYLPVRIEQLKNNESTVTMTAVNVDRQKTQLKR